MSNDIDSVEIPESPERETRIQGLIAPSEPVAQTQPQEPVVEEEVTGLKMKPETATFVQDYPYTRPVDKWDIENNETLAIPSAPIDVINQHIDAAPNIRLDDSEQGRNWAESIQLSYETSPLQNAFKATAERPGAEYHQVIKTEKMPLAAGIPNLKYNTGDKVSGERAVMRVRSLLGMGSVLQIPLWHSGFWITMKAPSEATMLELQRRLIQEKITLGRTTHGFVFANTSVYIAGGLMDFVLAHIYDTTLKADAGDLRKLIKTTDIPAIVWGLACTIWPNGFQYTRSCIADPEKCNHVIQERLNLSKIFWVDQTLLTKRQITHMTNRGGSSMSRESIENYQNDFTIGRGRTISLDQDDKVSITFKVPNIEEYTNSGYKWVTNIVDTIDRSMTKDQNDTTRNYHIVELGKATNMRQYAHWVESIDAAGNIIDDVESIEQVLDTLSGDDDIRAKYFSEIRKFIDDSTMAIVAVPSFECPKCQKDQPVPMERFPHLLPIDVVNSFFTLLVQRLQRVHTR